MNNILSLLLISMLLTTQLLAADAFPVQMAAIDMGVLATGRPQKIHLWYPRGNCPGRNIPLCLADTAVSHKVVVFSHGAMGSATEYSWRLAEHRRRRLLTE